MANEAVVVGQDSHRYRWNGDWAKLPSGKKFGYTHGVEVDNDADDTIYVFNQSPTGDAVCVFDRNGTFIKSWGKQFSAGAHGMLLSREGSKKFLYLADQNLKKIFKTTLDGEIIFELGAPDRPDIYHDNKVFVCTDVAVAPNGDFYVFDGYGQPYVHQYDKNRKYIRSIGGRGDQAGQLNCPHGGWVDTRGGKEPELYVADRGNHRIQVFTLDGKHKRFVTNEMKRPCCFFQWHDEMYIPDLFARLTILGSDDKPLAVVGDNPQAPTTEGWPNIQDKLQAGKFNSPHACCVDSRGNVYVVEWIETGRLTKLERQQ